jgi:ABC-type nitrate/sulfonate/bicarbonate transport system substrate-binding protein
MWKAGVVAMFAAALLGCQKSNRQQNQPLRKITVAYTLQPESALVHIARKKGFFKEEGLEIEPQLHTYGKSALKSVLDGKADLATVAETPVMFAVLNGEKICIIANIFTSSENTAIIARKDRGITSPKDLRGKRIAFTSGTTSDFFMDSFLAANGIERKDVNAVSMKPEDIFDALVTGKVDAACTWNFTLIQLRKKLGKKSVTFLDKEIYTQTFNIAGQQDFVKKNPEMIKNFLRALSKTDQFADQHPEEAREIVAASLQVDKNLVHEVWNAFNFRVTLDQSLLVVLEDETRWAIRNHLTDNSVMPNYLSYINVDALKAVKPAAVRIIQ